ncbi:MAG: hypothetical protein JXR90_05195 [Spirochaetes bacterium]|nr:hypothetical protein [Spirochaetota bacterium]
MSYRKWSVFFLLFVISVIALIGGVNYTIDPYDDYNNYFFNEKKIMGVKKIRFIKVLKAYQIKPKSIILGNSRAEIGFNPEHCYLTKPSYNMAISGGSMYENRINFKWALKQKKLQQVILVVDYDMFTITKQKLVPEFEKYFYYSYIYGYIFSVDTLVDSYKTIIGSTYDFPTWSEYGQLDGGYMQRQLTKMGGHHVVMKYGPPAFYKKASKSYIYPDTGNNSFSDFEKIVKQCYENDIKLDIVFSPSHIRQWKIMVDYHHVNYDHWLQWKKDIVLSVNSISNHYHKPPYRVFDFSVYHPLTAEEVPIDPAKKMKYHWENIHFKNALGSIVLDRLKGTSPHKDFGIQLTINNIDKHLREQSAERSKYIDIPAYN